MVHASNRIWAQCGVVRIIRGALCALFVAQAQHAGGAEVASQLRAEGTLHAFLDAFNTRSTEEIDRFVRTFAPDGQMRTEGMLSFSQQTGGFDLLQVTRSEPTAVEFLVKERARGATLLGLLTVSAAEPTALNVFIVRPVMANDTPLGYAVDASTRQRVIDELAGKLESFYVFPETARAIRTALERRRNQGAYDAMTDGMSFASELTKHLQEVSRDKHLQLTFSPVRLPQDLNNPGPDVTAEQIRQTRQANCGFEKAEILRTIWAI